MEGGLGRMSQGVSVGLQNLNLKKIVLMLKINVLILIIIVLIIIVVGETVRLLMIIGGSIKT